MRWLQEVRRFRPSTVSRRLSVVVGFYRTCVIDGVLEHSPADHVRRPNVAPESPTLGLSHLQFEALLSAACASANHNHFALVAMLGLLGLRIFEATGADIDDLGEEHGHRVLRVIGKGTRIVLIPLPPAVGRAIDHATGDRTSGPILLNTRGTRMVRHAATRRPRRLAAQSVVRLPRMHPHMLRHTLVTPTLDAGVDLRDVQIAARHAGPRTMRYDPARNNLDRHQPPPRRPHGLRHLNQRPRIGTRRSAEKGCSAASDLWDTAPVSAGRLIVLVAINSCFPKQRKRILNFLFAKAAWDATRRPTSARSSVSTASRMSSAEACGLDVT
ncbi:tyrosine-type recombinase/integrase [Actinomadura soli]|uniref:tyrosine-type recombinase/integrase n=1 Tax=Actinomadura soli TaxID=2508997 RepID=UPI001486B804|nr:tyrosine-type recombinase/integrase [Actinomadura soli]